jgi:uncharacterized protein YndB with AHSA1/START domain
MEKITVEILVDAPLDRVWSFWTEPQHIQGWAFASDDWEAVNAENDLRISGMFKTRMQAKDGSAGFEFSGTYTDVVQHEHIAYVMDDGRQVSIQFEKTSSGVRVIETFDPEGENTPEMQRAGWQAILENFKSYVEKTVNL